MFRQIYAIQKNWNLEHIYLLKFGQNHLEIYLLILIPTWTLVVNKAFLSQKMMRIHKFFQVLLNPWKKFVYINKYIRRTKTITSGGYTNNFKLSISSFYHRASGITNAKTLVQRFYASCAKFIVFKSNWAFWYFHFQLYQIATRNRFS